MKTALVAGGAACVWDDIASARRMFTPDIVVAVNTIGIELEHVDHWATYHPDKFGAWLSRRRAKGYVDPVLWSHKSVRPGPGVNVLKFEKGSSGLLAVMVARRARAERIVVCGIPINTDPHFDGPEGHTWKEKDLPGYRKGWADCMDDLGPYVRSMSGFTRELLGAPTREWLGCAE